MKDILNRIDCNFIPVSNILESIDWYVSKLGCKFMWHDGGYAAQVSEINNYGTLMGMEFTDLNGHIMGICSF